MTPLKKAGSFFDRFLDSSAAVTGAIIILVMLVVCVNVIMRYVFNRPIAGAEEITEYLLLFITFIGTAWLLREGGHVRVDILLNRVKPLTQARLSVVSSLIGVFICAVLTWYGFQVTWVNFQQNAYFPSLLEFPKAPILVIIPLGSLLLLIQFLRRTTRSLENWRLARKNIDSGVVVQGDQR